MRYYLIYNFGLKIFSVGAIVGVLGEFKRREVDPRIENLPLEAIFAI